MLEFYADKIMMVCFCAGLALSMWGLYAYPADYTYSNKKQMRFLWAGGLLIATGVVLLITLLSFCGFAGCTKAVV